MEKGDRSGRAACANFSHLCYFCFVFTPFKKNKQCLAFLLILHNLCFTTGSALATPGHLTAAQGNLASDSVCFDTGHCLRPSPHTASNLQTLNS